MNTEKIILNNALRNYIKQGRKAKNISVLQASEKIDKKTSYVSSIENSHILKINKTDLINLLIYIYDLSENEALEKIENLLKIGDSPLQIENTEEIISDEKNIEINEVNNYVNKQTDNEERFKKLIKLFTEFMEKYYEKYPDEATKTIAALVRNFQFDVGFMTATVSIPFFALSNLTYEEKQKTFDNLVNSFHESYILAKSKEEK